MTANTTTITRSWKSRLAHAGKRLLQVIGILLLVLLIAGLVYQFVASRIDERRYPAPGKLVKVEGTQLHVYCVGSGTPTVLLETGRGGFGFLWQPLMSRISGFARVCAFDRPGTGWSDRIAGVQTAEQEAALFYRALQLLGEKGPYVVMGNSLGGLYSQAFARLYRDQVVGMVLIESSAQDWNLRMPQAILKSSLKSKEQTLMMLRVGQVGTPFGLLRLLRVGDKVTRFEGLPYSPEVRQAVISRYNMYSVCGGLLDVYKASALMMSIPGPKPDFGDLPLVVLVAGKKKMADTPQAQIPKDLTKDVLQQADDIWMQLQQEHAKMSSRGELVVAEKSGHLIHSNQPELILESLQKVIAMAAEK